MANYNIPGNPQYSEQIRKLENNDSTSAELTFNPLISRIIENTAAVKKQVDGKAQSDLSNVSISVLSKLTVGDANTVDGKHAADLQNYNNLTNKPTIPTTLPANGGNADTVDGKHATDLQNYNNLTNKPIIPTTLPANGGNADTVDGKHATDLQNYNNLTNKPTIPTTLPANGGNATTVGGKTVADLQNYNNLTNKPATLQNLADGNSSGSLRGKNANSGYTMGAAAIALGQDTIAAGIASTAIGDGSFALGDYSYAGGLNSAALGKGTYAIGIGAISDTGNHAIKINGLYQYGTDLQVDPEYTNLLNNNLIGSKGWCTGEDGVLYTFKITSISNGHLMIDTCIYKQFSNNFYVFLEKINRNTYNSRHPSYAIGCNTIAMNDSAFAEGDSCIAEGACSHAAGRHTVASALEFAIGSYNKPDTNNNRFIIGNGQGKNTRSNCFRVDSSGRVYAQGSYSSTGADYAELFEWVDGNPDNEDRRGLFVALQGNKIKIANNPTDYIIGIISSNPAIIGNNYSEAWKDMYLTNIWGELITEHKIIQAEYETRIISEMLESEDGVIQEVEKEEQVLIRKEYETYVPILNPDYNPNREYIPRQERKEWGLVGMFGQLILQDNGDCIVDGYCQCGANGIGVSADSGYYIMERVSEQYIKVLFK